MDVPRWGTALLAHGVGGRGDLPVPFSYALVAAVVALLVSFAVLTWRWPAPRIAGGRAGHPLPRPLAGVLDSAWFRGVWRVAALVAVGYTAIAAVGGPDDALNPTAGVVYVLFWVGVLAFGSALLGPVWQRVNPLRTVQSLVFRAMRRDPRLGLLGPYPARLGYWPAALSLLAFVWLELVGPARASTITLRWWFAAYALVHLLGGFAFGTRWFARADGFEVLSTLFGRLAVLGRRDDGVLVVRSPLAGLDQLRVGPGLVAVVAVMLGSTAYDGVTQGMWWTTLQQSSGLPPVLTGTLGLGAAVLTVGLSFVGAARAAGWLTGVGPRGLPTQFAPSLVPIALGYVVAHYWSLFVLIGQQTVVQLSDPLGTGADWLGTASRGISYAWVAPGVTATLQVTAVVVGHVVGIVLAHDRATRLLPRDGATRGQLPLLAVMVAYTLGGLLLLFSE